jgi:hypothetical protein
MTGVTTEQPSILRELPDLAVDTVQIKWERLVVPETVDGFRASISALRSLGLSKGVSFHTFSLPDNWRVRLIVKNLGSRMPESKVLQHLV